MAASISHTIVNALVVARAASNDIIGSLHSLHHFGYVLNDSERSLCLHKARENAEQLLIAILKAEQEVAPVVVSVAPERKMIRVGDHTPELVHDLCQSAREPVAAGRI